MSWDAVAVACGIDVRRLYRLKLKPGAPAEPDVGAWLTYLAACDATGAEGARAQSPAELEREQADLRYAKARAATAEREDALNAGLVVTKAQALAAAGAVRDAFITEGELLPGAVLVLVPSLSKSERDAVENAVRAAWAAACTRIAAGRTP